MERKINKLKQIREERGFTQVQVADKVGITERGYQRYEAGSRTPNVYRAIEIAKALGTSVEILYPKRGGSPA